ncbi:MAG: hypothetical protein KAH30_01910, partial [Caldisericia bacterium]|nr:hypothetical protein [Caldisericia bacterium]
MDIFEYIETDKYKNYHRNDLIFREKSQGVFYSDVVSRIRLELMGSGAVVQGSKVLTGFADGKASYSSISSLIVPSTLLSSTTSSYITYSTNGTITFNGEEDKYLETKIKEIIRIQSVGGSVLIKKISDSEGDFINLYTPL